MHSSDRRTEIIAARVAETGIDEPMIRRLVFGFYDRVRADPVLGAVFDARIADWPTHLERMCDFWSSVALMTGRFSGQPMRAHASLPIDGSHFDRWLGLFERTASDVCPPAAAGFFVDRARQIAASLELGVAAGQGRILAQGERLTA